MKWIIIDEEVVKCIEEIKSVLDKYNFPLVLEEGILEDLKQGLHDEVHSKK